MVHRALPPTAGFGALRLHPDQAVLARPLRGVRDPLTETGTVHDGDDAPLVAAAVALDGLAAVLHQRREDTPLDVVG